MIFWLGFARALIREDMSERFICAGLVILVIGLRCVFDVIRIRHAISST